MPPINPDHAGKNNRLNRLLTLRVGDAAVVSVQDPLTLQPRSEPEPDLMLLRPRDDFYERANPTPKDTLLVIEICDSSLRYDREVKVPLYAAHGVPEVWLVDLQHRRLELYREPGADDYRLVLRPGPGEVVAPLLLPSLRIRVDEFW
jgi:Uma2 family endonuclease